ncbi:MAG: thiol-disulfide oxidoreductase DCC family protein [Ignavibacteria bacterium]|nr:thiol-disulfide oxidoreductase DCC family protein [Ignavibacteria bacterium]
MDLLQADIMNDTYKIILFDGVCNFCNGFVNFIIDRDKKDIFRFAALQSDFGTGLQKKLGFDTDELKTIILVDGGKFYLKSSAALRIAKNLPFPWNLSYIFIIVPPFIRNFLYDVISKNRYKWFGKRETCRLPSTEEKRKFI